MLTCIRCGTILTFWARSNYCDNCVRHMFASSKPIPLHETPIYAQLKAEREGRGRYSIGGWIKPDAVHRMVYVPAGAEPHLKYPETQATPKSRALLKKGRRK